MDSMKKWWQSRTVIAALLAAIVQMLGIVGISPEWLTQGFTEELVTLILTGVARWGRVKASKVIAPLSG